ncbi:MAG: hypothetical protein GXP08_09455 [Gammaproteobacteria bacterium]|nr:hypothetical protein [Gammaproteobacteria bacterium]
MRKFISIGITSCCILLFSTAAMADQKCKSVDIIVNNQYGKMIKVTKINYRDKEDKRWRDNNVSNTEITNGNSQTIDETLEYVGNETIPKMQVEFRYKENDGDWSDKVWSNVTTGLGGSVCVKNKDYNLTVSSIGSKQ